MKRDAEQSPPKGPKRLWTVYMSTSGGGRAGPRRGVERPPRPRGLGGRRWKRKLGFRFAAFCINLGPVLLRSASIWVPFCCVLYLFGPVLLRSALIWVPFCCVLYQFGAHSLEHELIL